MSVNKLSGQITVATAGTEVQGPDIQALQPAEMGGGFFLVALSTNAGVVFVGNNGDSTVSSSTGYELKAGNQIFVRVSNLNELWFDSAQNDEVICWLKA